MPNKYKRKAIALRGNWNEDALKAAISAVKNDGFSVRAAAITYEIPRKTLERRIRKNNDKKGPMGPSSLFGEQNETKLANHIKSMQEKGFPLTIDDVRKIAYEFAEQLKLKHRFNKETQKAGYDWLQMFLTRNPDITLRKAEGVSLARANAMNKPEVSAYFQLLERNLMQDNEMLAPNCIFNMDETGLQLNNRPGHVLAKKGSKAVSTVTSNEKGETITVIACCNAEGTFLPPACIMKGKNKKAEYEDGLPPGSKLFMSEKSAYITSAIFLQWLKLHFVPRKPNGKVLLLLDGHSTHCNSVEMLEYANQNDIILISMPSHTSHYLQPLDRSVFKSLKTHFYEQCRLWQKQNSNRRITRLSFGSLLNKAWGKAACAENAISGFKATGVHPFNPAEIPDYAFIQESGAHLNTPNNHIPTEQDIETFEISDDITFPNCSEEPNRDLNYSPEMLPRKSKASSCVVSRPDNNLNIPDNSKESPTIHDNNAQEITPSRILKDISPVPQKIVEVRKRAKQVGMLLTSPEHIKNRKKAEELKQVKEKKKILYKVKREREQIRPNQLQEKSKLKRTVRKRKAIRQISESTDDEEEPVLCDLSHEEIKNEEDNCRGCGENYYETRLIEDWVQCIICQLWVHENCTEFDDMCSKCGQMKKKKSKKQNN